MNDYRQSPLWRTAFPEPEDDHKAQRNKLATAYDEFRERVALLAGQIHKDMPTLTVHDIGHIDALWWTASEIAGAGYPLNPAEAFVLGGAFLLHDAAHCIASYPGGIEEIRALPEWRQFAAGVAEEELTPGSPAFQVVLFDVLRALHPKQARKLTKLHWSAPGDATPLHLLPHDELRLAYADAIGELAESHWWHPHELETLKDKKLTAPACLHPAGWDVDLLKLAVLLRTADAAHIDAQRARRFLMALVQPGGASLAHWQFQSRMSQIQRDPDPERQDLRISGAPFPVEEQEAWWLAYDAARLIDKELRAADRLLLDHHRPRLAVRQLSAAHSPEDFARSVPTDGWQPVDAGIKIGDVKSLVERFGGEKLYGDNPTAALRELLQNAIDAVHACRALGGLGPEEGEIEVAVEEAEAGHYWLHVTDTGIGMSRYVLTDVLLDFGRSLWRSADLRGEWSDLAGTDFEAIGQFGIGFFSVFMLGDRVRVTTRRYDTKEGESGQWLLEFPAGTKTRPVLRMPAETERLKRPGTRISVLLSASRLAELCQSKRGRDAPLMTVAEVSAWLAPAVDIDLYVRECGTTRVRAVRANDWRTIAAIELLKRIGPDAFRNADAGRFGLWSYLAPLHREDGSLAGRCAALSTDLIFMSGQMGVGVVNGLRAGEIEGLAGVVFVQTQSDLARNSAIPDISLTNLQKWAQGEKHLLFGQAWPVDDDPLKSLMAIFSSCHVQIDDKLCGILAAYGSDHTDLILGKLGGEEITTDKLVTRLSKTTELLVTEGEVEYDEDDEVLPKDFRNFFEPDFWLLELTPTRPPRWLNEIDDGSYSHKTWSLEAALAGALTQAWGDVEWTEEKFVVGEVKGYSIVRECRVARPKPQQEDRS